MHHRAVIAPARHAPDDGVSGPSSSRHEHNGWPGLHEIRAALLTEDFLGRDAAVLTDDTDDELGVSCRAIAATAIV